MSTSPRSKRPAARSWSAVRKARASFSSLRSRSPRAASTWYVAFLTQPTDDEETFGPVAVLYRFSTEDEALEHANDASVGLAGYFFSKDVTRCFRVGEALQVGMIGINTGMISQNTIPFGGVKESGFGREGGPTGINEYLVEKALVFGDIQ